MPVLIDYRRFRTAATLSVLLSLAGGLVSLSWAQPASRTIAVPNGENLLPANLPPASIPDRYVLGPGDRLQMEVFNLPEYSQEYRILADGTLSLPLIGTLEVAGMTLEQASAKITQRYSQFIRRPAVTLILLEARPLQIAIAGEVKRPGSYTVSPEEGQQDRMTVTQAIQLAGGITQSADIRQIQVRRPTSGIGGPQVVTINLWELVKNGNLNQDLPLRDGDTLLIPTATTLEPEEATSLATASFAPDAIMVYVVGEVESPGMVEIPPNTPLNQAILAAGGFSNRADQDSVTLVRLNANGTVSEQDVEVDFSRSIDDEQNPALRNYDTVVIGRSGLTRVTDLLGTILSPVSGILRVLNIFD